MGPVRIVTGGGCREGTAAIPGTARRGRAAMPVLAAAAGLQRGELAVAGGRRGPVRRHDVAEEVAGLAQQGIRAPGVTNHAGWAYSMRARSGWRAPGTARLMREAGRDLAFYQGFSAVSGALDSIGQAPASRSGPALAHV